MGRVSMDPPISSNRSSSSYSSGSGMMVGWYRPTLSLYTSVMMDGLVLVCRTSGGDWNGLFPAEVEWVGWSRADSFQ
jgi:hypothetical protein